MTAFILAREADAITIAHLRQRIWADTYRGIYPVEMIEQFDYGWHTRQDLARIQSSAYMVYLIMEEDSPVGYLNLKHGETLKLMSLYILPEYQRRGIGRSAFRLVRRHCAEHGISRFTCQCHPQNGSARAFYEAMGGIITARDEDNAESWQNSVMFSFENRYNESK